MPKIKTKKSSSKKPSSKKPISKKPSSKKPSSKKINKKIYFTLADVQKHISLKNAWTIIHNKVYRIPYTWITSGHPGGRIIERAIGIDATKLFDSIGHSDMAKRKLASFLIGFLKK